LARGTGLGYETKQIPIPLIISLESPTINHTLKLLEVESLLITRGMSDTLIVCAFVCRI
jgi:hypothetical protein